MKMSKELNHDLLQCEIYRVHILYLLLELTHAVSTEEGLNSHDIVSRILDLIEITHLDEEFCYRGAIK